MQGSCIRRLLPLSLMLVHVVSAVPSFSGRADGPTPVADLAITRVSGPKKAHACQIFKETYRVTNNGPDLARYIQLSAGGGDQFDAVSVDGVPGRYSDFFDLAAGQSRTIVAYFKVVGFVPGEERDAFIGATLFWDYYSYTGIDPNPDNNVAGTPIWLVGKPKDSCPL